MGPQRCLELLRVRTVHAERLLRPDGFGHTVRLDRTIVAAEGEVVEGLAVSAESPGQDGARRALELADPGEAEVAESLRHDPADTPEALDGDRKSTRLNSSHVRISYAVFCLKKKK